MPLTRNSLLNALKSFTPDVGAAVRRFPLASLAAVVFTLLSLFDAKAFFGLSGDAWMRVSLGLGTAFLWSFAVSLYAERHEWSRVPRFTVELAGFMVIALLFYQSVLFSLEPYVLYVSVAILVGLAAYVRVGDAPNAAFWQFNHHLWLGAGLSLVGALLSAGGLSLIVETFELLFEVNFPDTTHEKIWSVAFGLIAPLNWLSLTPRDFSETVQEGEQKEFTSRAVAVIVKYILVPLLLFYTAILYAYAVKIAVDGVLPEGQLGLMVLAYGALMTLTALFAWPGRTASGPLVAFFWRHWFWMILGPVALLFLALYERIVQYGVTDDRYMVAIVGVWFAVLGIWFLVRRGVRDLRVLPATLAFALFVASFGPWGAVGLSVRSQTAQLAELLERHGRMKDGQVVVADADQPMPRAEGRRATSIVRYLESEGHLFELKGWFAAMEKSPFQPGASMARITRDILLQFGAPQGTHIITDAEHLNFTAVRPISVEASGFDQMVGPIALMRGAKGPQLAVKDGGTLSVDFENNVVTVRLGDSEQLQFDLEATARKAVTLRGPRSATTMQHINALVPFRIAARDADQRSVFLVENLWGKISDESVEIRLARGWLLLRKN